MNFSFKMFCSFDRYLAITFAINEKNVLFFPKNQKLLEIQRNNIEMKISRGNVIEELNVSKKIFIKNCFVVLFSAETFFFFFYTAFNTVGTQNHRKGSDFSGYSVPAADKLFVPRVRADVWGTEMGMSFRVGGRCC